jgi:hypothetical protein
MKVATNLEIVIRDGGEIIGIRRTRPVIGWLREFGSESRGAANGSLGTTCDPTRLCRLLQVVH